MDHKVSKDMISSGMIPSGEKTQADLGRTQYGSAPSPSSLMDAYKSMYEHHQKDENGNTIPHEGENIIDENIFTRIGDALKAKPMQRKPGATSVRQSGANDSRLLKKKQLVTKPTVEKKPEVSTMTRQGKQRTKAQMMAANRIASGKTIADVKASNTQSMRDRARARNDAFKARRAERKTMMNDVDLFDLIKGRLIDEFYLEEKEALNLMVNLSEAELKELSEGMGAALLGGALATGLTLKGLQMRNKMKNDAKKRDTKTTAGKIQSATDAKNKALSDAGMGGY